MLSSKPASSPSFRLATGLFALIACLALDANAGALTLAWDTGATGTAGYYVHCGQAPRTYTSHTDVSTATTVLLEGLQEGSTSYCAVTAYNAARVESPYSNEVSALVPHAPPVVNFTASPGTGTAPTTVTFSNTTTGTVSTWSWSFGDGTYGTGMNPSHTYSVAGTYTVTLTATGPGGSAAKTLATPIQITGDTTTTTIARKKRRLRRRGE